MQAKNQRALAAEMLEFVNRIPASAGLETLTDPDHLHYFEAERLLTMRAMLAEAGFRPDDRFEVLDVGYLHGLVPEFLHRAFPNARFTVIDHPDSPIFKNPEYLELIGTRDYLKLTPLNLADADKLTGKFQLIILGEIIEHLDPTVAVGAINKISKLITNDGCLLITTPNAGGILNLYTQFRGRDAVHPVVPDTTMNWPHIHLWTTTQLEATLTHYGWKLASLRYINGLEARRRAQMGRKLHGIHVQIAVRLLWQVAQVKPRYRGYFVAIFKR